VRLAQGEKRDCVACGKPLIGARTKDGAVAPITLDVQVKGNVLLFQSSVGIEGRVFAGDVLDKLKEQGVPLRLNHFADCPDAERFRAAS
jgi:hypothetical protein